MSLIDREGTFRGEVVDGAPGVTSKDNLQLCLALKALEIYDFDEEKWEDWQELGQGEYDEITAYLVLISADQNEIFHFKSVEKAFEVQFDSVAEMENFDFTGKQIQFRTENSTYKDKTNLKVVAIDHFDAEPGQRVQKLDEEKVKSLDAKYASFFRGRRGEKKPVKPISKPKVPSAVKPKSPTKPKADKTPEKPSTPKKPEKSKKSPPKPKKAKGCTEADAWKAVNEKTSADDAALTQMWFEAIATVDPDGEGDNMNNELWSQVKDIVIERANSEN